MTSGKAEHVDTRLSIVPEMLCGFQPGNGACEKLKVILNQPLDDVAEKVAFALREPVAPHWSVMVTFVTVQVPATVLPLTSVGTHVAAG